MALPKTGIEPLDEYCEGVKSGEIPVCRWVRMAVDRHYRDLRRQGTEDFPYYFEPKACLHYVDFFREQLCHFDGIHDGKPIEFQPWQYFVWGSPFGWLKTEKLEGMPIRRFREMIIIIPKKQGKSIILAGTMLYMIDFDGWKGAQVYTLAKNRSHAEKLAYRDAETIVQESEVLSERFRINKGAAHRGIYCDAMNSFIQPLTSKPESTDGLKVQMSGNDEIKDWDNFEIYEVMKDGTAANPNSLIANITTAGGDHSSLGYDRQEKLQKILQGETTDEQTFGVIYTIDDEDKEKFNEALAEDDPYPLVEPIIKKANPNYGVSVGEDYYRERISDAQQTEREKNQFLTKHLNVWIQAMSHYFNISVWTTYCQMPDLKIPDAFKGKPCYLHLDLASKKDICSMYALFHHGNTKDGKQRYTTFGENFLPEAVVSENIVGHKSRYNEWAEQGNFVLTPGNTAEYDEMLRYIQRYNDLYQVIKVGFDDWNSYQLASDVKKMRLKVVEIKQNTKNLSEPMKTLGSWITYKRPTEDGRGTPDPRLVAPGDPVLTWALSNVVAKEDANENVFPRKQHEDSKIDPAVSVINLVALELAEPLPKTSRKRYPKVHTL